MNRTLLTRMHRSRYPALPATSRSERREVRNPILALPAAQVLASLPPTTRLALVAVLADLRADAKARADECWRKHKAPMAAYWKATAVYAGHLSGVLKNPR